MTLDLSSYARGNYFGFRTKEDLKSHVSGTVTLRYGLGEALAGDDLALMAALLARHRDHGEKIGSGLAAITVERASYGSRRFEIVRTDGSRIDFSWHKCMTDVPPPKKRMKYIRNALRTEIGDQTHAFKMAFFGEPGGGTRRSFECPVTGVPTAWATAHVDHEPPATFLAICEGWMSEMGIGIERIDLVNMPEEDFTARLVDRELAASFSRYHREHAKLRVISARANLSDVVRMHNAATRHETD